MIRYKFCFCSKRDGSTDSGKDTPQMQELKISLLEKENYTLSNKTSDNDEKNVMLEQNLRRFEEERRQFEMEKLKFLEDKRELDRLRLQRFERYKREIEAKRLGLRPNYDIDNNDYMVARKIVIDYKVTSSSGQDSGSESEPDITVVENVARKDSVVEDEAARIKDKSESTIEKPEDSISACQKSESIDEVKTHLNGIELINGLEKPPTIKGPTEDECQLEKVEFDDKNPMRLFPFITLLLRETRQIWIIHKRNHSAEWTRIKTEILRCLSELIMFLMFCGTGGLLFRYVEGNFEMQNKTGVKRVKRDFIDQLWQSSHNLR